MSRNKIKKIVVFLLLFIVLNLGVWMGGKPFAIKMIRTFNHGMLSAMLVLSFSQGSFNKNNPRKMSNRLRIINVFWAISFILSNFLEDGTLFKVLNLVALAGLIITKRSGKPTTSVVGWIAQNS